MFKHVKSRMQEAFLALVKNQQILFTVDVDKDTLWNTYLNSFPEDHKQEHNCNACRSFIRNYGGVVAIVDNKLKTIWDFESDSEYSEAARNLNALVLSKPVKDRFLSPFAKLGTDSNIQMYQAVEGKQVELVSPIKWEHFYLELPKIFTINIKNQSVEAAQGIARDNKNVFKRSLDELTQDSVETVLELISQNSLYRGEEHKGVLEEFLKAKKEYKKLAEKEKDNYCWLKANTTGGAISRIRNNAIGTFLIDLSEGKDLDIAVAAFERVVAPANYKRPMAIVTKRMIEDAEKTITELGYSESLGRRFALPEDISVNNVLFVNRDAKKGSGIFEEMKEDVKVNPKTLTKVEEISINKFIDEIVPKAKGISILLENGHLSNLMTLVTAKDEKSANMFKWPNPFSWSYTNAVTDSIKEAVKTRGGNVEGVLRFSIMWAEGDSKDDSDLDAHCIEPGGNRIYYSSKMNHATRGNLDVDITHPVSFGNKNIVENITWPTKGLMSKGKYQFKVHGYSVRGKNNGFQAEIEFEGQKFNFNYSKSMRTNETIDVATVEFDGTNFKLSESLDSTNSISSVTKWGLETNKFHKVSMIMNSPNHWDGNNVGNKHNFFIIEGTKTDETPRGFFNEFLKEDLMKHKRVFEILGGKTKVEESNKELSGVGFSSTQRNSAIFKVEGKFDRLLKVNF